LAESLANESWIWRPVRAGEVTLEGVLTGLILPEHLMKLNALWQMEQDIQAIEQDEMKRKQAR